MQVEVPKEIQKRVDELWDILTNPEYKGNYKVTTKSQVVIDMLDDVVDVWIDEFRHA